MANRGFDADGNLPEGFHDYSPESFYEVFVTELSRGCPTREKLHAGYLRLVEALNLIGVGAVQWAGGSFVSTSPDPGDLDLASFVDASSLESLAPPILALLGTYFDGKATQKLCGCDSHLIPKCPDGHPLADKFKEMEAYWADKFGHDWRGRPRGIAVLAVDIPSPELAADTSEEDEA